MTLNLKKTHKSDIPIIRDILKKNELAYQDIETNDIDFFFAFEDEKLIGVIGIEKFIDKALLRSMVVMEEFRDQGYGKKICNHFLEIAKQEGIKEVFLLTNDADGFFKQVGFEIVDRENAPDVIRFSTEFSSLCPASAIFMKITL